MVYNAIHGMYSAGLLSDSTVARWIEPSRRKCALCIRQQYPLFCTRTQERRNVHDIFHILLFSSTSPDTEAHERWGVWKWFNHRTVWVSSPWFLLYIRDQHDAVMYMAIFQLLCTSLIGEASFAMTSFLRMAAYPNNSCRGVLQLWKLLTQAAEQDCRGAMLRGTMRHR